MPESTSSHESLPTAEIRPSAQAILHLAHGEFNPIKPLPQTIPDKPFINAFKALGNQNEAIRKQDEEKFAQQHQSQFSSPEVMRKAHMATWAHGVQTAIGHDVILEGRGAKTASILRDKLHFNLIGNGDVDPQAIFKQLYDETKQDGGSFYQEFCTGNMNEKLAKALTIDDMMHLKTFLTKWMLGKPQAFDALVALRYSMDQIGNETQKAALLTHVNEPVTSERDKAILRFFDEGLSIKPHEEKKRSEIPVNSPTQAVSVDLEDARVRLDLAQQEIFANAGKRSPEQAMRLLTDVEDQLKKEKEAGKGKMKPTIQEMNQAYPEEAVPIREGEVVFLPKAAGRVVVLGDIHGDFATVQKVLSKEHVLEDILSGKNVQVVFMGDLVDRGTKDIEVMESVLALKRLFPGNITIMKADHETRDGVRPHEFPDRLKQRFGNDGDQINNDYVDLFNNLPRLVVGSNGVVIVHGGPAPVPLSLQSLATMEGNRMNVVFDNYMVWADPMPQQQLEAKKKAYGQQLQILMASPQTTDEQKAQAQEMLRQLNAYPAGLYENRGRSYFYDERILFPFLQTIGATAMLRAHQTSDDVAGEAPILFEGHLGSIHTTGKGSPDSAYATRELHPYYATFDLSKPTNSLNQSTNIHNVWN